MIANFGLVEDLFRETEESEDASGKYQSRSLRNQLSNSEAEESNNNNSTEVRSHLVLCSFLLFFIYLFIL